MHELPLAQSPDERVRPQPERGPFGALLEHRVNVLWSKRSIAPSVARALKEVAAGELFENKVTLDVAALDLSALLQSVSHPVAREFLAEDITSILNSFSRAFGRRHLHGQLVVLENDKCRKFHTDNVTVRLLCTYAGPGTEWVKNEDVVRENLARADVDPETANRSVLRAPDVVNRCMAGDLLLLKGEAYDGNWGFGAVHRSPPIAERSLRRLLFTLDERPCGC